MKLDFPATGRNKDFILDVLSLYLPDKGSVLEVASGSGQHICHFSQKFSNLNWIPSDPEADHRLSCDSWAKELECSNMSKTLNLNAMSDDNWKTLSADINVIICINMTHIAPFEATKGLFQKAKKILSKGELLYLYGPYFIDGVETAKSNLNFDLSLRTRNSEWGIRHLNQVLEVAEENSFSLHKYHEMPANNYSLIFQAL